MILKNRLLFLAGALFLTQPMVSANPKSCPQTVRNRAKADGAQQISLIIKTAQERGLDLTPIGSPASSPEPSADEDVSED